VSAELSARLTERAEGTALIIVTNANVRGILKRLKRRGLSGAVRPALVMTATMEIEA
jgi:hypothetical protein